MGALMHHSIMKKSTRSAFTLVELMIAIAILADLAVIALPAFIRSRNLAQNTRFVSDLRTCAGAFEMYAAENNHYPPSTPAGQMPTGMTVYMRGFPWTSGNSIGGEWVWAVGYQNTTAAVVITFPTAMDDLRMTDIDTRFDNGVLSTGAFREVDSTDYMYIIEN
jgi:prepilin-type N-terminal cleavage/methylation domain-containing protein